MCGREVDGDALLCSILRGRDVHVEVVSQVETRVCGEMKLGDKGIGCI